MYRKKAVRFKAIPYYLWGNREPGEMSGCAIKFIIYRKIPRVP
ncbi:hypothetical protein [Paenibacillus sp. YAF4_2]